MPLSFVILYLSIFFWIFPAVRQYRSNLFFYFLTLAAADPFMLVVYGFMHLKPLPQNVFYLLFFFFSLFSIYYSYYRKRYIFILSLFLFCLYLIFIVLKLNYFLQLTVAIKAVILFVFAVKAVTYVALHSRVNFFHVVLILYEISVIMKYLAIITDAQTGAAYFHITSIFQMFIGIFFSIFREENSKLLIELKNYRLEP